MEEREEEKDRSNSDHSSELDLGDEASLDYIK